MSRYLTTAFLLVVAAGSVLAGMEALAGEGPRSRMARPAIRGILYNEDDSHRFVLDPPGTIKPERLDQLVDELADTQVTVMLICCCAKTVNYPSQVWDVHCRGFDPAKDNRQPYFGDTPEGDREVLRRWAHNLKVLLDAGIDPMQRMIDRCRQKGISPWVSIRMNDVHDAHLLRSPLHSRFWIEHPEYWRYPNRFAAWNDRCLNYGLKPVRDHMMALIREVCERFDMDGLELDWNRFPLHFREGEEAEQGKMLSQWLAEVREVVRAAEKKRGHPIWLVARVPARPEVALGTGLDAVAWARRGLIDHLVVAPFWATTDFDIPVEQWTELLQGTGVGVTAGLEIRVQPHPGAEVVPNTPERRRGAALAHLARGSQGIYVFNYFENRTESGVPIRDLFRQMGSVTTLLDKDRSYVVTYADIQVPGRPIVAKLPRALKPQESAEFSLYIGPKPPATAQAEVRLVVKAERPQEKPAAQAAVNVSLNGHGPQAERSFDGRVLREGYNTIRVTNAGAGPILVDLVELIIRCAGQSAK
ncbi:MAG: family 10 glycosylhydrolase [Thermoguttaceae bacterium]|jgi:hypothetical protein|nr:family 10 glycosylhydrolase [Thermoguttaceae bacterium]